ncbi:MAG: hypothetical protein K8Q99_05975 [Acholeplasmataceae bacterium]|nr:hypothetical protein [Acholeplasmataceae bacterium]
MRRIVGIFLFISALIFLVGCVEDTDDLTDIDGTDDIVDQPIDDIDDIVDQPINNLDTYGFEFEMLSYTNPMFNVNITDIVFDVIQRKIHFHYEILDYTNASRYYFVYGYEHKDQRPFHPLGQNNFKSSTDYTLDLIYDTNNPEAYVSVEMGRYSASLSVIGENVASNSAGFKYRIKSIESRAEIDDYNIYLPTDDNDPYHQANAIFNVHDPEQTITSVNFVLSVVFMDNYVVEEQTIEVNSSMYTNDWLIIETVHFANLSPTVRYQITAYISGHDGQFEYEHVKIGISQNEMQNNYFIREAFHGLYCEIQSSVKTDETTHIILNVVNEGIFQIDGETPVLYLNFYHTRADYDPYLSIELNEGINDLILTNTEITLSNIIRVEDLARTIVFSQAGIYTS